MKFEFSSELMKNQKHAVAMSPSDQFEVLQTEQGLALFFSIGTDGVFYCTSETPGTVEGWIMTDFSSVLSSQFNGAKIIAKSFSLSQNIVTGKVDIALVVTVNQSDQLLVALNLENDANAKTKWWETPPSWQLLPYDDAAFNEPVLDIVDVYLPQYRPSESVSSSIFIVADILPSSSSQAIRRYFIDPLQTYGSNFVWNHHPLGITLQPNSVTNQMGRKTLGDPQGVYTLGEISGEVELIYSPLYDAMIPPSQNILVSPLKTLITLPMGAEAGATCMALSFNGTGTTDLFIAAAGSLYFLPSDQQNNPVPPPKLVFTHELLQGIQSLHVNNTANEVLVWGLNNQGDVFYLKNTLGNELTPGSWTVPLPLAFDAVKVSTYRNKFSGGSVIFALSNSASSTSLFKLTEDPVTTLWRQTDILLPTPNIMDVYESTTYTTHIQVNDDNNLPLPNQSVAITSSSPCMVDINNQFQQLSNATPLQVKSDAAGTITIIQTVTGLGAVMYGLQTDNGAITVNPMANVISKLNLISEGKNLDVRVPVNVPDPKNKTVRQVQEPLLNANITAAHKQNTALMIQSFMGVANKMPQDGSLYKPITTEIASNCFNPAIDKIFGLDFSGCDIRYFEGCEQAALHGYVFANGTIARPELGGSISSCAGDIFRWLEHIVDDIVHIAVTLVGDAYNFAITIGEDIYHYVIKCVTDVIHGIQFVLHKIAVGIEKLVQWLGVLFDWGDILRTHKVLKNLFTQFAHHAINSIDDAETAFNNAIGELQNAISAWAAMPDLQNVKASTVAAGSKSNPAQHSPQAHWGVYHLKNNAQNSNSSFSPILSFDSVISDDIINKLQAHLGTNTYNQINPDLIKNANAHSIGSILEEVFAKLLNDILSIIEDFFDALFKLIKLLASGIADVLNAPIDIPIISWLYKKITGDDLSVMDALCLVLGILSSIIYKLCNNNTAPFPDSPFTRDLIAAPDFSAIQQLYAAQALNPATTNALGVKNPNQLDTLTYVCNCSGFGAAIILAVINPIKTFLPEKYSGVASILTVISAITYIPYCAPNLPQFVTDTKHITQMEWYNGFNSAITFVSLIKALTDLSLLNYKHGITPNTSALYVWAYISPVAEIILNGVWEVPVVESYKHTVPTNKAQENARIENISANTAFNAGGIFGGFASFPGMPDQAKIALLVGMDICTLGYGALLLVEDLS